MAPFRNHPVPKAKSPVNLAACRRNLPGSRRHQCETTCAPNSPAETTARATVPSLPKKRPNFDQYRGLIWLISAGGGGFGAEAGQPVVFLLEGLQAALHDRVGGQGQVQLAAEGHEQAGELHALLGFQEGELDQAALDQVALGLGLEAQFVQELLEEPGPALPADDGGGPALELEADVVVVLFLGDVGVHDAEVVAQAGVEVEVILGNDGEALAAQAPLGFAQVVHGVGKD
jgi:hypothetical protein